MWLKNVVKEDYANVKLHIKQRFTMLQTLSEVVNRYGIHERETFEDTIKARRQKDDSISNITEQTQALDNAFLKIAALQEQYPQLKADSLFMSLAGKDSISGIETRFRQSVINYNKSVRTFNYQIKRFPTSIVASVHGLKEFEFIQFDIEYE